MEELATGVRNGVISPKARIYHNASEKWLPIEFHPHYKQALDILAGRTSELPTPKPVERPRTDTLSFLAPKPAEPPRTDTRSLLAPPRPKRQARGASATRHAELPCARAKPAESPRTDTLISSAWRRLPQPTRASRPPRDSER